MKTLLLFLTLVCLSVVVPVNGQEAIIRPMDDGHAFVAHLELYGASYCGGYIFADNIYVRQGATFGFIPAPAKIYFDQNANTVVNGRPPNLYVKSDGPFYIYRA